MNGLVTQLQEFLLTAGLGIVVGLVFHAYHLIIKSAGVRKLLLYLLDLLIWLVLVVPVFLALLVINHGEMRLYVLIALGLGGLIYRFRLARWADKPLGFMATAVVGGVRRLAKLLFFPFAWMKKAISNQFRGRGNHDSDESDEGNNNKIE